MIYNIEHRQDTIVVLSKEETNLPWLNELTEFSNCPCEYGTNVLFIFYQTLEDIKKAKTLCDDRNICYYPDTPFNKFYNGYSLQIMCHPQTLEPFKLKSNQVQNLL